MNARHKKIPHLTEEEEAEIQRQIAADPDDSEATDEQLAQAKPFTEAFPDLHGEHQAVARAAAGRKTVAADLDPPRP